jgi:hypothetical protein
MLLRHGADVNAKNASTRTPLDACAGSMMPAMAFERYQNHFIVALPSVILNSLSAHPRPFHFAGRNAARTMIMAAGGKVSQDSGRPEVFERP